MPGVLRCMEQLLPCGGQVTDAVAAAWGRLWLWKLASQHVAAAAQLRAAAEQAADWQVVCAAVQEPWEAVPPLFASAQPGAAAEQNPAGQLVHAAAQLGAFAALQMLRCVGLSCWAAWASLSC